MSFFSLRKKPDSKKTAGGEDLLSLFKKLDNKQDDEAREYAARVLMDTRDKNAVLPLIAALEDNNYRVRKFAARALGNIGDVRAIPPLIEALKNDSVSREAGEALGNIKASADSLISALKINNAMVQKNAIIALGNIGVARSVDPILKILKENEDNIPLAEEAIRALGKIGDPRAIDPLIAIFQGDNFGRRITAASALGKFKDPRILKSLSIGLDNGDWSIRYASQQALVQCGYTDEEISQYRSKKTGNLDFYNPDPVSSPKLKEKTVDQKESKSKTKMKKAKIIIQEREERY